MKKEFQPFLGDFHIHSTFSDGALPIPRLIDFYGKMGFGVIAITDHLCESQSWIGKAAHYLNRTLSWANFPLYREILRSESERAWKQYRMVVLPGVEFTKNSLRNHRSAHILGIGIDRWIAPEQDAVALTQAIRAEGGMAVAAHPVSTQRIEKQTLHLWSRREELREHFDAWEVASGPVLFDEVKESGLPMLASSDLHRPEQIRSWKTVLRCERHPEAILQAIQKQELEFTFFEGGNHALDIRTSHSRDCDRLIPSGVDHVDDDSRLRNLLDLEEISKRAHPLGRPIRTLSGIDPEAPEGDRCRTREESEELL